MGKLNGKSPGIYAFQLADAHVILTFELEHYFLDSKIVASAWLITWIDSPISFEIVTVHALNKN